jgi:hypothetical protein
MSYEEDKILLFGPKTNKSLLRQYPELAQVKEFKAISGDDLVFAWYLGNQSSPIDPDWEDAIKFKTAASYAIKEASKRQKYASGDIPENVKEAIEKMKAYSPEARMVAKRMIQTMFQNFQKLVDVNPAEFVTKEYGGDGEVIKEETDWTGRKQYIDSCSTISKTLPALLDQLEKGFGIEEKEVTGGKKSIDKFHQINRENS